MILDKRLHAIARGLEVKGLHVIDDYGERHDVVTVVMDPCNIIDVERMPGAPARGMYAVTWRGYEDAGRRHLVSQEPIAYVATEGADLIPGMVADYIHAAERDAREAAVRAYPEERPPVGKPTVVMTDEAWETLRRERRTLWDLIGPGGKQ